MRPTDRGLLGIRAIWRNQLQSIEGASLQRQRGKSVVPSTSDLRKKLNRYRRGLIQVNATASED